MPFFREDRAPQPAHLAARLGYLRLLALRRLASNGRKRPGRVGHRRKLQILARTVESIVEVAEQVFLTELDQHIRAHQSEHGLRMHVGEQEEGAVVLAAASELVQGVQSGRIDGWNIAQAYDEDLGLLRYLTKRVLELLRCSKEEGTVDLEHLHIRWNLASAY